jgi:hypothetical protein
MENHLCQQRCKYHFKTLITRGLYAKPVVSTIAAISLVTDFPSSIENLIKQTFAPRWENK